MKKIPLLEINEYEDEKLSEISFLLTESGIEPSNLEIEWIIQHTRKQIEQWLQYQTRPKFIPAPETISYKVVDDFLNTFYNTDIQHPEKKQRQSYN